MRPWWDAYPERLEAEIASLRADGIEVHRDDGCFAQGFVRLNLLLPEGKWLTRQLYADFPDSFPYIRPEVYAPDLALPKHQHPINRNLCLLERATVNWQPSWTLARLLGDQLPLLAQSLQVTSPEALAGLEVEQGEPITEFLPYEDDSIILIDGAFAEPTSTWGVFAVTPLVQSPQVFRGYVSAIADEQGNELWTGRLGQKNGNDIVGSWIRLNDGLPDLDPNRLFERLRQQYPSLRRTPSDGGVQLVAVLFPEEQSHVKRGLGWAILLHRHGSQKRGGSPARTSFIRADRAGVYDLASRFPQFATLQQCRVAVFGLGCMGAPSVLEFARAGTHTIRMLDHDRVEAGTVVRWSFGIGAAGLHKAKVLLEVMTRDYPWVTVEAFGTRIGTANQNPPERDVVKQMTTNADLIYDATAEIGVQQVLSDVARASGTPYICLSATQGGWGGIVARFNHRHRAGCWWCFQAALDHEIPLPAFDPSGEVQPAGCNRITYVGANFDLMEVALQGVRLAVATLAARKGDVAADYPWDVAVVNLRDECGKPIAPRWSIHSLACNPKCPVCGRD